MLKKWVGIYVGGETGRDNGGVFFFVVCRKIERRWHREYEIIIKCSQYFSRTQYVYLQELIFVVAPANESAVKLQT